MASQACADPRPKGPGAAAHSPHHEIPAGEEPAGEVGDTRWGPGGQPRSSARLAASVAGLRAAPAQGRLPRLRSPGALGSLAERPRAPGNSSQDVWPAPFGGTRCTCVFRLQRAHPSARPTTMLPRGPHCLRLGTQEHRSSLPVPNVLQRPCSAALRVRRAPRPFSFR